MSVDGGWVRVQRYEFSSALLPQAERSVLAPHDPFSRFVSSSVLCSCCVHFPFAVEFCRVLSDVLVSLSSHPLSLVDPHVSVKLWSSRVQQAYLCGCVCLGATTDGVVIIPGVAVAPLCACASDTACISYQPSPSPNFDLCDGGSRHTSFSGKSTVHTVPLVCFATWTPASEGELCKWGISQEEALTTARHCQHTHGTSLGGAYLGHKRHTEQHLPPPTDNPVGPGFRASRRGTRPQIFCGYG